MLLRKKHILCFDLDGTLINSKEAHVESYKLAFKKNKLADITTEELYALMGIPSKDLIRKVHPELSVRKLAQCTNDQKEILISKCRKLIKPILGAAEIIEVLSHKYILVLISTNNHADIIQLAKAGGIDPKKFRLIIGEDEVENPKPAPDAINNVKEYIASHIEYFIGDTIYDIQAAKAAGVHSVGVLTGVSSFEKLWAEKPTHVIASVAELPDVLK